MAVIAFIPVRGGSKSIPLKNIKSFCGKPLIYWNLKALEEAPSVDRVVVSTDSQAIRDVVESFGFSKPNYLTAHLRQQPTRLLPSRPCLTLSPGLRGTLRMMTCLCWFRLHRP